MFPRNRGARAVRFSAGGSTDGLRSGARVPRGKVSTLTFNLPRPQPQLSRSRRNLSYTRQASSVCMKNFTATAILRVDMTLITLSIGCSHPCDRCASLLHHNGKFHPRSDWRSLPDQRCDKQRLRAVTGPNESRSLSSVARGSSTYHPYACARNSGSGHSSFAEVTRYIVEFHAVAGYCMLT